MFVALDDVRAERAMNVEDPLALEHGERAAHLFERYYTALEAAGFPSQYPTEPDVTGARELIEALVVLSDVHLRAPLVEVE